MTDFETALRRSLRDAASSHEPGSLHSARERFAARHRWRTGMTFVYSTAVVAALIIGVIAAPWEETSKTEVFSPKPLPQVAVGEMVVTQRIDVGNAPSSLDLHDRGILVGHAENFLIEAISTDGHVTELISFVNEKEAGIEPSTFVDGEGDVIWTASDGHVSIVGRVPDPVPIETGTEDSPDPSNRELSGSIEGFPWEGLVSDLEVGPYNAYVGGSDPHGDATRYAIGMFDFEKFPLSGFRAMEDVVDGQPRLEYGFGHLWAAHASGEGGLLQISVDPYVRRVVEPEPGGSFIRDASDISVGGGRVWAFGSTGINGGHTLVSIDPETARSEELAPLPGAEDSRSGVVEASDELGVFVMAETHRGHRLYRVDPSSGEVLGEPLDFGAGPFALESGYRSLWVADQSKDEVLRIEVGNRNYLEPKLDWPGAKAKDAKGSNREQRIKELLREIEDLEGDYAEMSESYAHYGPKDELTPAELENKREFAREIDALIQAIREARAELKALRSDSTSD